MPPPPWFHAVSTVGEPELVNRLVPPAASTPGSCAGKPGKGMSLPRPRAPLSPVEAMKVMPWWPVGVTK